MYKTKDISVIIPTYNRAQDLKKTLSSIDTKEVDEILIIDQSPNKDTKKLIEKIKDKKIKYIFSDIPSLTMARNIGISKVNKKSKIVCFFDDDITLGKNYFQEIIKVFNAYQEVKGVSAWYLPEIKINKIEQFVKKIFFIENLTKNSAKVLSVYGNTYPRILTKEIKSQWLSGFNMCFRKEAFDEFHFDNNFSGYSLAEDFDFSYRIYKKYPCSLLLTPHAKITHRASIVERNPTEKSSYMNQINHFYLNYKNFDSNLLEKFKFAWCLFGISLLRTLKFLLGFKNKDWLKLKYFFKSLGYCIKILDKIKKGKLDIEI